MCINAKFAINSHCSYLSGLDNHIRDTERLYIKTARIEFRTTEKPEVGPVSAQRHSFVVLYEVSNWETPGPGTVNDPENESTVLGLFCLCFEVLFFFSDYFLIPYCLYYYLLE